MTFKKNTVLAGVFVILVFLIHLLLYRNLLEFSLAGDDWLALVRFYENFDTFYSYFDLSRYVGNYDLANILVGVISLFAGYNPTIYFTTSIILRFISSLSFYLPISLITKNKLSGFLAVLLFSFSYAGIQTTDWAFNMSSFISIAFMNLFFFYWYKFINKESYKYLLIPTFWAFFSFITTPNRMAGLIPIIIILEVCRNLKLKLSRKNLLSRTVIFLFPIILFRYLTATNWDSVYLNNAKEVLSTNFLGLLKNLVINFNQVIYPNLLLEELVKTSLITQLHLMMGLLTLLGLILFYFSKKNTFPNYARLGIFAISFGLIFQAMHWIVYPQSTFPSSHRYHIISSAFITYALTAFLMLIASASRKVIFIVILTIYISVNSFSVNNYLNGLLNNGRKSSEVNSIFETIQKDFQPADSPAVFYFESKDPNYLYNAVTFGFTPHMMMLFPEEYLNKRRFAPFVVDNKSSLSKILNNNQKELSRYGYDLKETKIDKIYVYRIKPNGEILSIE